MTFVYLTLEQAVEVHRKTVEVSGGGALGHLDLGKLDSVLQNIQNDNYYPTFDCKLTHLFFCCCKFHCFEDGNKRIAITLCAQLLLLNGYLWRVSSFMIASENISYHVAAGAIKKELLGEWIAAMLRGEEDEEELKLKIYNAIASENA